MITHKEEILNKVDQIVVLKEGVVIDNGTYDELAGKNDELNIMIKKWINNNKIFLVKV